MNVRDWLARCQQDADARGLPELKPLLETLARSTEALRATHPSATPAEAAPGPEPGSPDQDDTGARPRSTILDAGAKLRRGEISSTELTRACLERIHARNTTLRAFITVLEEQALADAARADAEMASGHVRGPLHGIPVSVKDLVDVVGTLTTSGSAVPVAPATRDAAVVEHLRRAGAVIVGKTNLHEFAFGTTSDETAFGAVHHPLDHARSAGGSSGGAAVAILEGMCLASVGTDTGGSIRIPAAACGITGLKPTFGEVPTAGVVPLSETFDHVGPLARTVADCALAWDAMRGRPAAALSTPTAARLKFAVPQPYFFDVLEGGVREAVERARRHLVAGGHEVRDVEIAHAEITPDVYLHISLPEAASYHASLLREHAAKYSPGVRLRIEMGGYVLAEDYVRAMHVRDLLRARVDAALGTADALMLPGLAIPAPPLGAASVPVDGGTKPVRAMMLRLTQLFNITGHPAIVLPCGNGADGLPRSLQLVGRRGHTGALLRHAAAVEALLEQAS